MNIVAGTANGSIVEWFAARYLCTLLAAAAGPFGACTSKLTRLHGLPAAPVDAVTSTNSGLHALIVDAIAIAATGVVGVPGAATTTTAVAIVSQAVQFSAA
jgi:L-cystine uptake protein TcyP (sodium:dicarboxylate symporter family)